MSTLVETATDAINLFRIRFPAVSAEAKLIMDLAGRKVSVQEIVPAGGGHRRFWVKIAQDRDIESIQMELVEGRLVQNLAAPDGKMAHLH
jgi:hypothetical protein